MRTHSLQLIVAVLALVLNHLFSVIGICYLRPVDNDPLQNAGTVVAIDDDSIKLADGRAIRIYGGTDNELRTRVRESANRIGVETNEAGDITLYVKEPRFTCGLGMPMVTLPVIPINSPRYRKKMFAFGKVDDEANTNRDGPGFRVP